LALAGPKESGGAVDKPAGSKPAGRVQSPQALGAVELETMSFILSTTVDKVTGLVASCSPKYLTVDTLA